MVVRTHADMAHAKASQSTSTLLTACGALLQYIDSSVCADACVRLCVLASACVCFRLYVSCLSRVKADVTEFYGVQLAQGCRHNCTLSLLHACFG